MRAGEVLHNVLAPAGVRLDARLWRRLYGAVEALVRSRQVVLMELARQYPEATRVAAPLKALDRLLSNRRLQQARGALYGAALQRLWPRCRTVIVVDWCVLKADESLHLLRAALPVGGRALPVWDEVHGQAQLGHAEVHTAFLARLRRLLPVDSRPIVVTDAGFRMPWFRSAEALGLACIGRVRGLTQVRPVGEQDWVPVQAFVEMEDGRLLDLGLCEISKTHPQRARLVVCKRPPRGRKDHGVHGRPRRSGAARAHARGAREPWVLAVSPALADLSAEEVVRDYARRMQIEESFRDLKDPRQGAALRHALTRKAPRMEILILLHALASVLAWWRGLLARQQHQDQRLLAHGQAIRRAATRATLSLWRIGWELLRRGWPPDDTGDGAAPAHPCRPLPA